jgi:hypothetical protein
MENVSENKWIYSNNRETQFSKWNLRRQKVCSYYLRSVTSVCVCVCSYGITQAVESRHLFADDRVQSQDWNTLFSEFSTTGHHSINAPHASFAASEVCNRPDQPAK